ncbi:50S ribosomal protein L25 [Verrucomicrobiota bacterium]|jgi:large subunit ribosomal protein L25|nr:50S ribosomal protein L25 [Verrucomicrobiota bacterium]GDX11095.1 50S ribosomal protein L25 [Verrucomicrobiota bacterium]
MAKAIQLKAQPRSGAGTVEAKKARHAGLVPAVIYGRHLGKPQNLQLNAKELKAALGKTSGEHVLVDLEIAGGEKTLALIQDVQHHALKRHIMHLDFHALRADEKMHTTVPVLVFGEASGVKNSGGIIEQLLRSIEVQCLPKDLPDSIVIDVTPLEIGDAIHIKDLPLPEGVTALGNPETSVLHVAAPAVEEVAATPAEGAAATEPEVIKEKKPEAGAEAAAAGDKGKDAKPAKK